MVNAVHDSAEAQLFRAWFRFEEVAAEVHALKWHSEEPFSSRPLQFLTTLHAIQGQYAKALDWVTRGLIADPEDNGLLRNLAFHQAAHGELHKAEATIKRIRPLMPTPDDPYLKATQGLIALRRGEFERGGALYREAEQAFVKNGHHGVAALCLLHYAKYAAESGVADADKLLLEAEDRVHKNPTVDALLLLSKVSKNPTTAPMEPEQQRRLTQWVFDPLANTLTQHSGVTAKGAPSIVTAPPPPPQKSKK